MRGLGAAGGLNLALGALGYAGVYPSPLLDFLCVVVGAVFLGIAWARP